MNCNKKIFLILLLIFVSCKKNEATKNAKTVEFKTSTSDSIKEDNSSDFVEKKFTYLFQYSEDNSTQIIGINIINNKTIHFHLITETLPCDTEYWGVAVNKFWDGDGEIDVDSEGAYFADEYLKEEKEFLIGIRLAEDLNKVKINYIQKDGLNTDCLPITEKIMKRIK
jgi:hypothetical protein